MTFPVVDLTKEIVYSRLTIKENDTTENYIDNSSLFLSEEDLNKNMLNSLESITKEEYTPKTDSFIDILVKKLKYLIKDNKKMNKHKKKEFLENMINYLEEDKMV